MKRLAFIGLLLLSACAVPSAGTVQTPTPKLGSSNEVAAETGMPAGGAGKTPGRADAVVPVAQAEAPSSRQPPTNEAKATGASRRVATTAGPRLGKDAPSGDAAIVVQAVLQAMAQRDVANFCLYRLASADAAQGRSDAAAATTAACADVIRAYARSIGADDLQSASAVLPPLPAVPATELSAP